MRTIEIRTVTADDADFLFSLMNDPAIMRALNEPPSGREDWSEAVRGWLADGDESDYIVWKDGQRIGWFAFNGLQSADRTVFLKMAVILPECQQRGIGAYVLSRLLEEVRKNGYVSVALFTNKDNMSAQRCYQKCGFNVVQELSQEMSDGTIAERYKMERRL